jgi:hypothetical protein
MSLFFPFSLPRELSTRLFRHLYTLSFSSFPEIRGDDCLAQLVGEESGRRLRKYQRPFEPIFHDAGQQLQMEKTVDRFRQYQRSYDPKHVTYTHVVESGT